MAKTPLCSGDLLIAPPLPLERLDPLLRKALCTDVDERGQVTVHLSFTADIMDSIRIRPSTCLICRSTGHRSPLVHAEGIPYAPTWLALPPGIARNGMDVYGVGLSTGGRRGSHGRRRLPLPASISGG